MADTIIVTYKLKDPANLGKFRTWSREVDVPRCRALPVCVAFDTYVVEDADSKTPDVIEVIVATSRADWDAAMDDPGHQSVMETWNQLVDEGTVLVMDGAPV